MASATIAFVRPPTPAAQWARVGFGWRGFFLASPVRVDGPPGVRQTAYNGTMKKAYPMRKAYRAHRGDLMRRIAALHAKAALAGRDGKPTDLGVAERAELKRQIAALTQQMMAP